MLAEEMTGHAEGQVKIRFAKVAQGKDRIGPDQLRELCVALGINYTEQKHQMLVDRLDPDGNAGIDFSSFYHWLKKRDRKKHQVRDRTAP